jgi:hypothetical protein
MRTFSPFIAPVFDDEPENWIDVTHYGGKREYLPGLRDYGPKGFAWLKASRDYIAGHIDIDEYECRLNELLGIKNNGGTP